MFVALGLALAAQAHAQNQNLYKCKNDKGRITYAERECKELGLLPAGEVKGEISVSPSLPLPATSGRKAPAQPAAEPVAAPEAPPAPTRRCFTVRNAKGGTSTRCNDDPDQPEAPQQQ